MFVKSDKTHKWEDVGEIDQKDWKNKEHADAIQPFSLVFNYFYQSLLLIIPICFPNH